MLCGLGLGIVTRGISADIISYAVLFGLLLIVVLIDHRRTLLHPETLAARETAKPEPTPATPLPTKAAAKKPRFSLPAITSIFSIFKRRKKTDISKKETEPTPAKVSETVQPETPKKEEETPKETTPKTEAEEKTPESPEPFPSKTEEKEEEYVQAVVDVTSSGGTSTEAASGGLPQFVEAKEDVDSHKSASYKFSPVSQYKKDEIGIGSPIKDTSVQPLELLKLEEKDKHEEILENVEKIYPKELGLTEEQIDAKKKKIDMTSEEKPPISKEELEALKQKITDRKKEIENETTVIQDVKTDFENIQVGLDSLKNKLENLGGEIESTVKELVTSSPTQKETQVPVVPVKPRKKIERKIEKTLTPRRHRLEDKKISSLKKARAMLEKLDRRVGKLERIYVC
jgi:hypothetical protein